MKKKHINDNEIQIEDCPGFHDTDGPVQEIANSFSNKKLMENINHLKIIFVATMSSITDNHGVMFVNSLNNFTKMF